MNRFAKYVMQLDNVQEKARKLANDLNENYNRAKLKHDALRADRVGDPSRGAIPAEMYVDCLTAKAKLAEAEQTRNKFWENLPEQTAQKIAEIRAELAAALDDAYSADPKQLDAATITLLESGICDAHEYGRLLADAAKHDNVTLARVIGSYADKTADKAEKDLASGGEAKASEYRAIATQAAEIGKIAEQYMGLFDSYANAIQTATSNPDMLGDSLDDFSANTLLAYNNMG